MLAGQGFIPGSRRAGFLIISIGFSLESSPHFDLLQVVLFTSLLLFSYPLGSVCVRVALKGLKSALCSCWTGSEESALHGRSGHAFAQLS